MADAAVMDLKFAGQHGGAGQPTPPIAEQRAVIRGLPRNAHSCLRGFPLNATTGLHTTDGYLIGELTSRMQAWCG
jgi:hypothetical protein